MQATQVLDPRLLPLVESLAKLSPVEQDSRVMEWLTGDDEDRRTVAIGLMTMTDNAAARLVRAALAPGKSTVQQFRLLQAVEEIGQPIPIDQRYDLMIVKSRSHPVVRLQIERVLASQKELPASDAR